MGINNRRRFLMGEPDRHIALWIALSLLLVVTACGFPRPPDVGGDTAPGGCSRDQDCSSLTPFCVNTACAACRDSTSCPAARPVCDVVSHDCRTCAKDSECDSGACDLAAGRCIDQGAILYVSPGGTNADACTLSMPCSLRRAAELVDSIHAYIVLQTGHYLGGADFTNKVAFLIGKNSSIDIADSDPSPVNVSNNSSISMRNVFLNENLTVAGNDICGVVQGTMSELIIDNMKAETHTRDAICADKLTIRHSDLTGFTVQAARLVADRCIFRTNGPGITGSAQITNSIIFAGTSGQALFLTVPMPGTSLKTEITNNTFIGGTITCQPTTAFERTFDGNIFYNLGMIPKDSGCTYQYNLAAGNTRVTGTNNITGDPLFTDILSGDLHVKVGSPAIDAANPANTSITHDFDNTPRPQGPHSDIGAFEYVPVR